MVEINATIKKGVSRNTGKEYILIEIPITDDYKKVVFLDKPEQALVKMTYDI